MKYIKMKNDMVVIVDNKDYEWLNQWKWCSTAGYNTHYAMRKNGNKNIFMHRLIKNAPCGMVIHHRNGFGLDNRRKNIVVCTQFDNMRAVKTKRQTQSGFRGVSIHCMNTHQKTPWYSARTTITSNGEVVHIYLGGSKYADIAAQYYDVGAKLLYKNFAVLNFPKRSIKYDTTIYNNVKKRIKKYL